MFPANAGLGGPSGLEDSAVKSSRGSAAARLAGFPEVKEEYMSSSKSIFLMASIFAAIVSITLALMVASVLGASSSIVLKEDFTGSGEYQSNSDYYGVKDGVTCRNASSIIYGHSFMPNNAFSGVKVQGGENSYTVRTEDHYLRISQASWINTTAKISAVQRAFDNVTNTTIPGSRFTLFSATGNGTVREMALTLGTKGRPVVLSSLRHRGPFRINSSTSYIEVLDHDGD
jgi:hypothetical protein